MAWQTMICQWNKTRRRQPSYLPVLIVPSVARRLTVLVMPQGGGGNLLKLSGLFADVKGTKCVFAAGGRPKSASGNMNV